MPELRGAKLTTREVLADDRLFSRYAARVPVLRIGRTELDWPFDAARLRQLLDVDDGRPIAASGSDQAGGARPATLRA